MSPNYPNNYENNKDCQITIRFAPDQAVAIIFEVLDVMSDNTGDCHYDYLAVHDGDSISSPMIGPRLCVTSPAGTKLKSTGNVMTLHFHTSSAVVGSGFKSYVDYGKKHDKIRNFGEYWNNSMFHLYLTVSMLTIIISTQSHIPLPLRKLQHRKLK